MSIEFNLINMSDPYTFEAEDYETAALTVLVLSTAFGAESRDGKVNVPITMFYDAKQWYTEEFHRTPDEGLSEKKKEVSEALLSFILGGFNDRDAYKTAIDAISDPNKREQFISAWNDKRTSLNDIGKAARQIGEKLKKHLEENS